MCRMLDEKLKEAQKKADTRDTEISGLRQKVANYPGVTVEQHIGRVRLAHDREVDLVDLRIFGVMAGKLPLTKNQPSSRSGAMSRPR